MESNKDCWFGCVIVDKTYYLITEYPTHQSIAKDWATIFADKINAKHTIFHKNFIYSKHVPSYIRPYEEFVKFMIAVECSRDSTYIGDYVDDKPSILQKNTPLVKEELSEDVIIKTHKYQYKTYEEIIWDKITEILEN